MKVLHCFSCGLLLLSGCGRGPKHINAREYEHGKAAFEMLEQFEKSTRPSSVDSQESFAFEGAAVKQIIQMDLMHPSPLQDALQNYEDAISQRMSGKLDVGLEAAKTENAELTHQSSSTVDDLVSKQRTSEQELYELEPIIKLCHDDADQFFDGAAAATNTCGSEFADFKRRYKIAEPGAQAP